MAKKIMENNSLKSLEKDQSAAKLKAMDLELRRENKAIGHIGGNWKERKKLYTALENHDVNYSWDEHEVKEITDFCNEGGESIEILQHRYKRGPLDIRVLLFDLALAGDIEQLPADF